MNLTKKPGRIELSKRVCRLAGLTPFGDSQLTFSRDQLVDLTLYLENTSNLLNQMKERLEHGKETNDGSDDREKN